MTPKQLEIHLKTMERSIDDRFAALNESLHKMRRHFNMEINEIKKRGEHYSPKPRDPIVPPPFPEALRDLGLEEPNGDS